MKKQQHSSYWLGGSAEDFDLEHRGTTTGQIIRLAAIKQSVTNFIRILTGKAIPVMYSSGYDSYTNGERVVLSASTREKNLDAVVGLALHEGSHVKLTDFSFLKAFSQHAGVMIPDTLYSKGAKLNISKSSTTEHLRFLMNVIEDRRIDYFIYRTAPGYRPYYEAMYDHYFRNRQIDYAIQLGMKREPTVENYIFYITNMTNRYFDTRHLKGLSRINAIIDLDNIERLDKDLAAYDYVQNKVNRYDTNDWDLNQMPTMFKMACEILDIVYDNSQPVPTQPQQGQKGQKGQQGQDDPDKEDNLDINNGGGSGMGEPSKDKSQKSDGDESDDDEDAESNPDAEGENDDEDSADDSAEGSESDEGDEEGEGKGSTGGSDGSESDSDKDMDGNDESDANDGKERKEKHAPKSEPKGEVNKDKLRKALKAQKDFIEGKVKKSKISKKTNEQVKAMEQSGAVITDVDHPSEYGGRRTSKVLILRKLTREIMESGAYPFVPGHTYARRSNTTIQLYEDSNSATAVRNGLRAGAILAQRLQVRNQTQVTKFNRKTEGQLDKRRLHALGFEDDTVFYRLREVAYNPVFVHITLDASGSMQGDRWEKALTVCVALAVAAEKIENLNVVVSIRAGVDNYATISIIYDSRVDTTAKIKSLFKYLTVTGSTPEGLAYAAILDEILNVKAEERYFINLSDGEPCWTDYSGESAWKHTREQVNIIRNEGIHVLSYFVGNDSHDSYYSSYRGSKAAFQVMYGKDASFINVTQVPSLVTTLNRLFLQR